MRGLLVILLVVTMLGAGCATPAATPGGHKLESEGTPSTAAGGNTHAPYTQTTSHRMPAQPSSLSAPPITDNMTVHYRGAGQDLWLRLRPTIFLDAYGQPTYGHVATVNWTMWNRQWTMHYALGPCMTPVWALQDGHDGQMLEFAAAGDVSHFNFLPGFLLRHNGTEAPPPNWLPLNGTSYGLDVGDYPGYSAAWWHSSSSGAMPPEGRQMVLDIVAWKSEAVGTGRLPSWVEMPRHNTFEDVKHLALDAANLTTSGKPIAPCAAFAPAPNRQATLALTARATREDPPHAWSLHDMIAYAESDTSLATLQAWKDDPKTLIYEWIGSQSGHFEPSPGVVVQDSYTWQVMYGGPQRNQALYVTCQHTVQPVVPTAPSGTKCSEYTVDKDRLRRMPPLDLAAERIVAYDAPFALYKRLYHADACAMDLTYNGLYGLGIDTPILPAFRLSCDPPAPELLLDAHTGAMQRIYGRVPDEFQQPPEPWGQP
ncbi:MAG: hypothetical protein V4510_08050 [bacterium]